MSNLTIGHVRGQALQACRIPSAALAAGTGVLSLAGELPVEFLEPGDRIITRSGARILRSVEVTVVQNARVIRLSPHVLGANRPGADLVVAPDQPILIRDWRAQALYGAAQALVPAARLADGEYIRAETLAEVRLYTLRFDADEVIYAGGLELACPAETVAA